MISVHRFKEIILGFFLQNVHVHLPGWTGGPDALRDVPGPGDEDGMCISCSVFFMLRRVMFGLRVFLGDGISNFLCFTNANLMK